MVELRCKAASTLLQSDDCRADRLDVEFRSETDLCRAWLYLPAGNEKALVIVMAHGSQRHARDAPRRVRRAVSGSWLCLLGL